MNKYTKEQKKAVDSLRIDLDELDNKPRRLYSALREFAYAFLDEKSPEHKASIINRIDQAEVTWYGQWDYERSFGEMLNRVRMVANDLTGSIAEEKFYESNKRWRKEATDEELNSMWRDYCSGVSDMEKKANIVIIANNYSEVDPRWMYHS